MGMFSDLTLDGVLKDLHEELTKAKQNNENPEYIRGIREAIRIVKDNY